MTDDATEQHLDAIERRVRAIRGEPIEGTPWDYSIPTANELRAMRKGCGLSREEFAEMAGYAERTVENYETGDRAPGREYIITALRVYRREWPR